MKQQMDRRLKLVLVAFAATVLVTLELQAFTPNLYDMWEPRHMGGMMGQPIRGDLEIYYTAKIVLSSVNTVLLLSLLLTYIGIYNDIRSEFSLGLIIFSLALLLYSLTSNPLLSSYFGYAGYGLGPFAMLPDLFTLLASTILIYLSLK